MTKNETITPPKKQSFAEMYAPKILTRRENPSSFFIVEDITKDYGDGHGIDSLSFVAKPKELIMLVGPNGAGKSTFLNLCTGLLTPTSGDVFIDGYPAGMKEARAITSYIPDTPVLYDDLSVWEHMEYIARLHNTQNWESYGEDLLEMFLLTERADDLPITFSRGLRQKTSLILGLIRPFQLLLIDEPFVGLDTPGQKVLTEILTEISEQGACIICSTHQLDLVPHATRCIGIFDGSLSYDGDVSAEKILELVGG